VQQQMQEGRRSNSALQAQLQQLQQQLQEAQRGNTALQAQVYSSKK